MLPQPIVIHPALRSPPHKPRPSLVRLARVEADLTQTELAQKIRAKQKSISRYETGASVPTIDTLVKIASALRKPSGYFLDNMA